MACRNDKSGIDAGMELGKSGIDAGYGVWKHNNVKR